MMPRKLPIDGKRPVSLALAGSEHGTGSDLTSYSIEESTGFRRLRQPAALVALTIGNLPESDRAFCRSIAWASALSAHEARRLSGIVSRACREVGL